MSNLPPSPFSSPVSPYATPGEPPPSATLSGNPLLGPGIGLIVVGTLYLLYGLLNTLTFAAGLNQPLQPPADPAAALGFKVGLYAVQIVIPLIALVTLGGGVAMVTRRVYAAAVVAAVLNCIPLISSCCVLGMPFGIWAVVFIFRPEVKALFR